MRISINTLYIYYIAHKHRSNRNPSPQFDGGHLDAVCRHLNHSTTSRCLINNSLRTQSNAEYFNELDISFILSVTCHVCACVCENEDECNFHGSMIFEYHNVSQCFSSAYYVSYLLPSSISLLRLECKTHDPLLKPNNNYIETMCNYNLIIWNSCMVFGMLLSRFVCLASRVCAFFFKSIVG